MLCGIFYSWLCFSDADSLTDKLRSRGRKRWQASVTHAWMMSKLTRRLHRILPHCFFVFISGAVKSMMLVTGSSSSQEIVLFRPQFTPFLTHDVDALDAVCTFALTTTATTTTWIMLLWLYEKKWRLLICMNWISSTKHVDSLLNSVRKKQFFFYVNRTESRLRTLTFVKTRTAWWLNL